MATQDYGHYLTDKSLEELERQIAQVYKEAADEMSQTVNDYFAQFKKKDAEQKKLVDSGELSKEEYQRWRTTQMARGQRYETMRDKLAERYTNANEVADAYVNDLTPEIYSLNRNYSAYQIEQAGADVDFSLWDESTVRNAIARNDYNLMPSYPAEKAVARGIDLEYGKEQITKSITSGILQGKSIYKIADDLQKRIETMSRDSAIRTARTAISEAENAGRQDSYDAAQEMGIDLRKQWVATLDSRTRESHREADGQIVSIDKPFFVGGENMMYPANAEGTYESMIGSLAGNRYSARRFRKYGGSPANVYNCRCTMVPVLDEVEDSGQRWSKDEETGEDKLISGDWTYERWMQSKERPLDSYPKLSKEESILDSIKSVNPNGYHNNCPKCVWAFEARQRGYDVTAQPSKSQDGPLLTADVNYGWPSVVVDGGKSIVDCAARTEEESKSKVIDAISGYGDGARCIVRTQWKGDNAGHVFIGYNEGGQVLFADPQSGTNRYASDYFNLAKPSETQVLRIDDKPLTQKITKCIT